MVTEKQIIDYFNRHIGTEKRFDDIETEEERFLFVATKTYFHFVGLLVVAPAECYKRAVRNAELHRRQGYEAFVGSKMVIRKEA